MPLQAPVLPWVQLIAALVALLVFTGMAALILLVLWRSGIGSKLIASLFVDSTEHNPRPVALSESNPEPPVNYEQTLALIRELTSSCQSFCEDAESFSRLAADVSDASHSGKQDQTALLTRLEQSRQELTETRNRLDESRLALEGYLAEARTDGLTELPNRRAFDEELKRRTSRAGEAGTLTLAIIDVDRFKAINDAYGHPTGDDVLRQVASSFKRTLGQEAFVARYGGEEFAVLMDVPVAEAAAKLDQLRATLAETGFLVGDTRCEIQVSIGVSGAGDDQPTEIVRRADAALYHAKHSGRNRTCFHDGAEFRDASAIE